MALYRYKALDARGTLVDGQMEAASEADVAARLQAQGQLPVEARPASDAGGAAPWRALFKPAPFAGALWGEAAAPVAGSGAFTSGRTCS